MIDRNLEHLGALLDDRRGDAHFLETVVSEQYYGAISDALASELAKWDDPDVAVTRMPVHEAGFTRTNVR